MDCVCTIFFEDPFWVGVFERNEKGGYSVARYVFGSEPTDAQLLRFAAAEATHLVFSAHTYSPPENRTGVNFKRRQRLARKETSQVGIGTLAQRTLQAEREHMKQTSAEKSRVERQEEQLAKFQKKQAAKKEKHRGR